MPNPDGNGAIVSSPAQDARDLDAAARAAFARGEISIGLGLLDRAGSIRRRIRQEQAAIGAAQRALT